MRHRHTTSVDEHIASIPLFASLEVDQLRQVSARSTTVTVRAGQVLCREGFPSRELAVLLSTTALLAVDGVPVAVVGPGDHLTGGAAHAGGRHRATATATADGHILVIAPGDLRHLLATIPRLRERLLGHTGDPEDIAVVEVPHPARA